MIFGIGAELVPNKELELVKNFLTWKLGKLSWSSFVHDEFSASGLCPACLGFDSLERLWDL